MPPQTSQTPVRRPPTREEFERGVVTATPTAPAVQPAPITPPSRLDFEAGQAPGRPTLPTPAGFGQGPPPAPVDNPLVMPHLSAERFLRPFVPFEPDEVKAVTRVAGPAVGSIVGGTTGFTRGGIPGGVIGAGTGAAAGELVAMGAESLMGAPPTVPEFSTRMLTAAPTAMTAEAVGVGGPAAIGRGLRALPTVRNISRLARRTMTDAGEHALRYMEGEIWPSQVSDSALLKIGQNVAQGSLFSSRRMRTSLEKQLQVLNDKLEAAIAQYGPRATRQEAGETLQGALVREASSGGAAGTEQAIRRGDEVRAAAGQQAHDILTTGQTEAARLRADADRLRQQAQQAYDDALADTQAGIGAFQSTFGEPVGPEGAGALVQAARTAAHKGAREAISGDYNAFWNGPGNVTLDATSLFDQARALGLEVGDLGRQTGVLGSAGRPVAVLERAGQEAAAATGEGGLDITIPGMQHFAAAIKSARDSGDIRTADRAAADARALMADLGVVEPGMLTARQVHILKSFYGKQARRLEGKTERGPFAVLAAEADALLRTLPAETYQAYQALGSRWADMVQTFEKGSIAYLAKREPHQVLTLILGANRAGGRVATVRTIRDSIREYDPEAWPAVQAQYWADLTRHPDGTPLSPDKVLANLRNVRLETLREIYDDGGVGTIGAMKGGLEALPGLQTAQKTAGVRASELEGLAETRLGEATSAADTLLATAEKDAAKLAEQAATSSSSTLAAAQAAPVHRLVARLLSQEKGNATDVAKLRAIVGEEAWPQIQSVDLQYLLGRMGDISNRATNVIEPAKLLRRLTERGEDAFIAAHGRALWDDLHRFIDVREQLAKAGKGGEGKMWIQLAIPGAIGATAGATAGILTGDLSTAGVTALGTSGAIILGPVRLARIFTNPRMREELLKGMIATEAAERGVTRMARVASRAATNLAAMLGRDAAISPQGRPGAQTLREATPEGVSTGGARGMGAGPRTGAGGAPAGAAVTAQGPPPVVGRPTLPAMLEALGAAPAGTGQAADQSAPTSRDIQLPYEGPPPGPRLDTTALVAREASAQGVDPRLVSAVIAAESSGRVDAQSSAGARGLMQLKPETAAQYGVTDLTNPVENIKAGVAHLATLVQKYGGDLTLALAAYNAGEGAVARYGGVPPFPETQAYVRKVLGAMGQAPQTPRP